MSKNTGTSELINYFDLGANGDVGIAGSLDINTIANATTDTDKFLVSDTGIIKYRTGAQLLSDIGAQAAGNYVTTDTSQAITANKSFTVGFSLGSEGSGNQTSFFRNTSSLFSGSGGTNIFGFNSSNNIYFGKGLNNGGVLQWNNTTATRYYTLPDADGTLALTSQIPANAVGGTGTTNYLPKFTGASTIGNSVIQESGGLIGIGSTPSYLLNVISVLDGSLLEIKSTATANNTALRIGIDANNAFINATGGSTGILEFRTYGSTKAIITQTGNVLIGNPPAADNGAKLQVSGTATFSSSVTASASFISNVVNGYGFRLNRAAVTNYNGISHATGGAEKWFVGMRENLSSNNYIIYNEATGVDTLTLNSTTSAATFSSSVSATQLNATTTAAGYASILTNTNGASDSNGLLVKAGSISSEYVVRFAPQSDASTFFTVKGNGNVGIGTASPSAILDVRKPTASGDTQFNFVNSQNSSSGNTSITSSIYLGFFDDSNGLAAANKIVSGKSGDYTSAPTANSFLAFHTTSANSTAERMRITSGGNVGIGVNSGNGKLFVKQSNANFYDGINCYASSNDSFTGLGNTGSLAVVFSSYNTTAGSYSPLAFYTSDTERMRITSGGNVGINNNNPGYKLQVNSPSGDWGLHVKGVSTTSSSYGLFIDAGTNNNDNAFLIRSADSTRTMYFLRGDGLINTGTSSASPYNNSTTGRSMVIESSGSLGYLVSTRESKANIESITNIDFIKQLNPVQFNYRKKDSDTNAFTDELYENISYGFIADEVEELNKELVFYNENGTLAGVEYNSMIAILTKAIQELKTEIDSLKNT